MTYAELRKAIELFTSNTDPEFLSAINSFIRQTESRIGGLVSLPAYSTQFLITATVGQLTTSIAATGFQRIEYIYFPTYGIIEKKDPGFIREAYPDVTELGPVRYFAMQDNVTVMWGPTPAATATGTVQCTSKWPSIVDLGADPSTASQETFVSSNFEGALLHGCLYQAALYMKDFDAAQNEKQEMMECLGLITTFSDRENKQKAEKGNLAIVAGE